MSTFPPYEEVPPPDIPEPPGYPDPRPFFPHPYIPCGLNDAAIACDEIDGRGVNTVRYATFWDDIAFKKGHILINGNGMPGMPGETGTTIDLWVQREKREMIVARDPLRRRIRATGFRGHAEGE